MRTIKGRYINAAANSGALLGSANLLLKSQAFDNAAWTKSGQVAAAPTVTADAAVAPDGTTTADKLDFPAVTSSQYSEAYQSITTVNATYTVSIYIMGVSSSGVIYLGLQSGVSGYTACNFVSGQWTRFSFSLTATAGTSYLVFGVNTVAPLGTPTSSALSVYAWGAQFQAGGLGPYRPAL
jgi:hypothetical protein